MHRSIVLLSALVVTLMALAGCGSSGSDSTRADAPSESSGPRGDGTDGDEPTQGEPSGDPVPLPVAPAPGAEAPDVADACEVLDTYVTRDEVFAIYEAHGFEPTTWSTGGGTDWENAWTDRWSSTCLLAEYPGADDSDTEKVGFDLSNYGDGEPLAPADHPIPALGPQGYISETIGYVIWEQDGWRLSIEGGNASEDDLQASVELSMLIHDRIVEGPGAAIPADVEHDTYLESEGAGGEGSGDLFGSVQFTITTDNGYVWSPTVYVGEPGPYAEAESAVRTDCVAADPSVLGLLSVGINADISASGANDVTRKLTWQLGGFPSGSGFSGSSCFSPDSALVVEAEPGDSSMGSKGYLLLPGYYSPAQPEGDLEAFYDLTLTPGVSDDTMEALSIGSYEVEVTAVSYTDGKGNGTIVTVPAAELEALDGVFSYRLLAPR